MTDDIGFEIRDYFVGSDQTIVYPKQVFEETLQNARNPRLFPGNWTDAPKIEKVIEIPGVGTGYEFIGTDRQELNTSVLDMLDNPEDGVYYQYSGDFMFMFGNCAISFHGGTALFNDAITKAFYKNHDLQWYRDKPYELNDLRYKIVNAHPISDHENSLPQLEQFFVSFAKELAGRLAPVCGAKTPAASQSTADDELDLLITLPFVDIGRVGELPEAKDPLTFTYDLPDGRNVTIDKLDIAEDLFSLEFGFHMDPGPLEIVNPDRLLDIKLIDPKGLTISDPNVTGPGNDYTAEVMRRSVNTPANTYPINQAARSEAEVAKYIFVQDNTKKLSPAPWSAEFMTEKDVQGRKAMAWQWLDKNDPSKPFTGLDGLTLKLPVAIHNDGDMSVVKFDNTAIGVGFQADFQAISENSIFLIKGKVSVARSEQNTEGTRFVINTPYGTIASDKTRFWVAQNTERGYTLVGIYEGKVSITHALTGETSTLAPNADGSPAMAVLLNALAPQNRDTAPEVIKKSGGVFGWVIGIIVVLLGGGYWFFWKTRKIA